MEPITRKEVFLAAAGGQEVPELTPVTRKELFLAKAAGRDVADIVPVTREEWFINQIQGGGVTENMSVTIKNADNSGGTIAVGCVFYDSTHDVLYGTANTSISAGGSVEKNAANQGGKLVLNVNVIIKSVVYEEEPLVFSNAGSGTTRFTIVTLPQQFDNSKPIVIAR